MRPATCLACGGMGRDYISSRRLPCPPCSGKGFTLVAGEDRWARYREFFGYEITPERLALEESVEALG